MHVNLEEETIGQYLINYKIKLREVKNKKKKIAKRRFIKSYDSYDKNDKYYYKQFPVITNNQSDTELYVYDNNQFEILQKKSSNKIKFAKKGINNINKDIKKSLSSDFQIKNMDKKQKKKEDDIKINDHNHHLGKKNNSMIKDIEKNIFSDNFDNPKKSNLEKINTNINLDDENDKDTLNCIIKIKDSNDLINNKKKSKFKDFKSKYTFKKSKTNILVDSSSSSSESKLFSSNRDKDKDKLKMDNIVLIEEKKSTLEDELPKKSNKIIESFNEAKKILSWKRLSLTKNLRKKSISNNLEMLENSNVFNKNQTMKESKLTHKTSNNVLEKNDNCTICMSEIKEKYTLICGDFFVGNASKIQS
jgi:hypothetical protein